MNWLNIVVRALGGGPKQYKAKYRDTRFSSLSDESTEIVGESVHRKRMRGRGPMY